MMLALRYTAVLAAVASSVFAFIAIPADAKRAVPRAVQPAVAQGITYSAPVTAMGFVVAFDTLSHRELWRQRIYTIRIDRTLERDVQDVFITSLKLRGGSLVITNERGERYVLDLSRRKVTRVNDRNT